MKNSKKMQKKNIIIFTPNVSRVLGGISNTAYYLAKEFSTEFKVSIITSLSDNETIEEVKIISPSKNNKYKNFIFQLIELKKILSKLDLRDTIILCMSWRCALIPFLFKKVKKIQYFVLCHGNDVLETDKSSKKRLENYLRKQILQNCKHAFANSKYTCNLIRKITNKVPISIIHPCSGEDVLQMSDNIFSEKQMVLSIGRLEKRKGFQYVIEAIGMLKDTYPDIHYYMAGDGPYKSFLEELIKKRHLKDNCFLLGRITEEEKRRLLLECTLLTMPSFFDDSGSVEGFGIVFIEANAYGKPVIGTYSGGIPDAIKNGKTGVLIKEKSVDELVEAISNIVSGKFEVDVNECFKWAELHNYREIAKKYMFEINKILGWEEQV